MIKLKINDKVYGLDVNELEMKITQAGMQHLQGNNMNGKRGLYNSLVGSAMMMLGIHKPDELKDIDNLEFASRYALHMILQSLDNQTISIEANEVQEVSEDED